MKADMSVPMSAVVCRIALLPQPKTDGKYLTLQYSVHLAVHLLMSGWKHHSRASTYVQHGHKHVNASIVVVVVVGGGGRLLGRELNYIFYPRVTPYYLHPAMLPCANWVETTSNTIHIHNV